MWETESSLPLASGPKGEKRKGVDWSYSHLLFLSPPSPSSHPPFLFFMKIAGKRYGEEREGRSREEKREGMDDNEVKGGRREGDTFPLD